MRYFSLFMALCTVSCTSSELPNTSHTYIFIQEKGDQVIRRDTLERDSAFVADYKQLLQGNIPQRHKSSSNDSTFDASGKLIWVELGDDLYGASVKKYFYDEANRLIKAVGYNKEGKIAPYVEYCAIAEYEYNAKGQLMEIRHLGMDSAFVLPCAVPPVIPYTYDALGNKMDTVYLDREGRRVEE